MKTEVSQSNQYLVLVIMVPISATKVLLKIIVLVEWAGYNQNNSEDYYVTTLTNQATTDHI